MHSFRKILVYGRPSVVQNRHALAQLIHTAEALDLELEWHPTLRGAVEEAGMQLPDPFLSGNRLHQGPGKPMGEEPDTVSESCGLVLALGGDGTLLDAVQIAVPRGLPVFGFHFGRLGFLSSAGGVEDFEVALRAIRSGNLILESRSLLHCIFESESGEPEEIVALNEVGLQRQGAGLMGISCRVNGELLNHYQADGLLVSTPTGSTAYSMSCGGPIVLPQSQVWLVTPVAGHQLGIRPVLVPDRSEVVLEVDSNEEEGVLYADGKRLNWSGQGPVVLSRAGVELHLARLGGFSHFQNLKSKLHWGRDARS
jgi:NAD+ kinase